MRTTLFEPHHTAKLLADLRRANSEAAKKERVLLYLQAAFSHDVQVTALVEALALGAERTIANIPRKSAGAGSTKTGRADTQTETIIIEWERDLQKTGPHAVDQLAEYLAGNWHSGQEYRFTLIATDGIRWRLYAPEWKSLKSEFALGAKIDLRQTRSFDLSDATIEDFPFFLDEVLFVSKLKVAGLENIQNDFGSSSATFLNSIFSLRQCVQDIETRSELRVAFDQWRRFLSIAYGKFDDSPKCIWSIRTCPYLPSC